MKNLALINVFLLFVFIQAMAQNRINSWDTDKITTIKVEIKTNGKIEKSIFFSEKKQMDKIFKFLKSIEFKETGDANIKDQSNADNWKTRFIFRGHRDWVMFYDNYAIIGKSSFWIEKDLNDKVKELIEKIENE